MIFSALPDPPRTNDDIHTNRFGSRDDRGSRGIGGGGTLDGNPGGRLQLFAFGSIGKNVSALLSGMRAVPLDFMSHEEKMALQHPAPRE